ncbi:MAG: HesA/MoeB/ThiF family protein [Luminiphilus sp.]|nr:HesA/MoeB/ThiF family protein [Luminiphilus sp.]
MAELTDAELARYARQLILPEVDLEGQSRLKRGRVLIIGGGGLGTPIAQYLSGAGVGAIRIADNDHIELSNLPRQLAYTEQDVGQFKADVLARRLVEGNPGVAVDARVTRFDSGSAPSLLEDIDLVLDATDSLQARLDIDRATFAAGLPWVMGAAARTSGQWAAFDGGREQGCYHCLVADADQIQEAGCAELGILGPVVGLVALQQSLLALKYLLGANVPWGQLRLLDAWSGEHHEIAIGARKNCSMCQNER